MDNNIKKLILPIGVVVAAAIFIALLITLIKPVLEEYDTSIKAKEQAEQESKRLEQEDKVRKEQNTQEEMKLKSLKPIYQADIDASESENLGIFGTMFDDIIQKIQSVGLYIRSIEYDMHPENDPIFKEFSTEYNVCELKFFLVGTYTQLQAFLVELNNNYPYLTTISKLDVADFTGDTNYILADLSLTLYSKKTENDQKNSKNKQNEKK